MEFRWTFPAESVMISVSWVDEGHLEYHTKLMNRLPGSRVPFSPGIRELESC